MRELPTGWEWRRITDVVSFPQGQVSPQHPPYSSQILVAPDHIEPGSGRLLEMRTAADQGAVSGKYVIKPGDVIYSKIRPALRKAMLSGFHGICSADMYPLRPSLEVDPRFLLAVLLSDDFTQFADAISGRSGIPKINRKELAEYHFPLPSIGEQRRIVQVIDELDGCLRESGRIIGKVRSIHKALVEDFLRSCADGTGSRRLKYSSLEDWSGLTLPFLSHWPVWLISKR